jgi:hypothetical protein
MPGTPAVEHRGQTLSKEIKTIRALLKTADVSAVLREPVDDYFACG